ncbi:NepR family anti-sigma factor [Breoghania sp.]|uniref:NepR family anti-sigma factor n=1 Tax=Breoghania sp. TaxID=2065378 RepID=UPI002AAC1D51|nr:NepR family anti-sigma factor [Breoghania sp.]
MADEDNLRRQGIGFSDDIQSKIGTQLKSIYDSVLDEPVPDRIAMLLQQLEEASPADSGRERNNDG